MTWPVTANDARKPRTLRAFGSPIVVSTETPIVALTEWGLFYSDLAFTLRNLDATKRAALYVDQSESGLVVDADREIVYVDPLQERRVEFRNVLSLKWGSSASGDPDAGFAAVSVLLQIVGLQRIR